MGELPLGTEHFDMSAVRSVISALEELGFSRRESPSAGDLLTHVLLHERPPIRVFSIKHRPIDHDPSAAVAPSAPILEAFAIERGLSLAHMKSVVLEILTQVLGDDAKLTFSPLFMPSLAPAFSILSQSPKASDTPTPTDDPLRDWLQVGKAGMIHPNVFESGDYDSDIYTGFVLELRLEHLTWLKS